MVRLDWTYEPSSAAAAAATTAEDEKPAYYCQMLGSRRKIWYVTGVYSVEGNWTWDDYSKAWRTYVTTTLKLDPGRVC